MNLIPIKAPSPTFKHSFPVKAQHLAKISRPGIIRPMRLADLSSPKNSKMKNLEAHPPKSPQLRRKSSIEQLKQSDNLQPIRRLSKNLSPQLPTQRSLAKTGRWVISPSPTTVNDPNLKSFIFQIASNINGKKKERPDSATPTTFDIRPPGQRRKSVFTNWTN